MRHPPHDDSDAEVEGQPQCGQDELELDREAPLDHHLEELQAALDELARRKGPAVEAAGVHVIKDDVGIRRGAGAVDLAGQ